MNKNSNSRYFFLGILILLISFSTIKAQSGFNIQVIEGRAVTIVNEKPTPLQGVKVTLYKNDVLYTPEHPGKKWKNPIITDESGAIEFPDLPFNFKYKITFEKTGYLTMYLTIDGTIPTGKDKQFYGYLGGDWYFFKTDDKTIKDPKKFEYPFTKAYYQEIGKDRYIKDDEKYMDDFTKGIVKEMQADEQRKKGEQEALDKAEREKKAAAKIERMKNAKEEIKSFIKISANISVFNKKWSPLSNKKIELVNKKGEVVETTKTNELGGFAFTLLKADETFLVRISDSDPSLPPYAKITITNKNGKEIGATTLDEKGKMKFELLPADMTTLSLMKLDDENKTLIISGKLFTGDGSNKPIAGSKVNLLNDKGAIVKSFVTNGQGEFEFNSLAADQNYIVSLDASDMGIRSLKTILLRDKKGNDVKKLEGDASGKFQFRMLIADNKTLSYLKVEDTDLRTELAGKLFAKGPNGQALVNIEVQLLNDKEEVIQTTKTDETGKFLFTNLTTEYFYAIKIDATDPQLKSLTGIILKDANNNPVKEFEKIGNAFKYDFLSYEENKLEYTYADDPWLKVLHFKGNKSTTATAATAKETDYSLKETVYFKPNEATLQPEAKKVLDKVIGVMETLPDITVELSSHTDSRGSDAANMALSEKRAKAAVDYIIANGISASRIVGKGYGETKLVNRCGNGVTCSEEEHAQNRRIEFVVKRK